MTLPKALDGIALERLVVGGRQVLGERAAAGVVVLDDRDARERELAADLARGVEVVEVVEAELLAVQLRHLREQVLAQADLGVVRGALVRVLAVLELEDLLVVAHDVVGEVALGLAEPVGDDEVVVRRAVEGLGGEPAEGLVAELAGRLELVEDLVVVVVAGDHRDAGVVLGGGADHARAADVDVLDDDLVLDAAPSRRPPRRGRGCRRPCRWARCRAARWSSCARARRGARGCRP